MYQYPSNSDKIQPLGFTYRCVVPLSIVISNYRTIGASLGISIATEIPLKEERRLRVFENRVLRRIFGPKRDEVTGEWRKLCNEELNGLYSLPNIVRVIKSRRLRWAGHVTRMGKGEACTGFRWGNLRERDRWGDPGVDGRIMLGWILKKWDVGVRTELGWLRIGIGGGRL
jgi:hypothetical protein